MLIRRSLKKQLYLIPIFAGILLFSCRVWEPSWLIVPLPYLGFIDFTEYIAPFLIIVPISFLLYNNYEIELAMTCGVSTVRLVFTKFAAIVVYMLASLYLMIGLYKYLPFEPEQGTRIVYPIVVPEHYKIHMLISATVTVLFFASVILFLRVLLRNCYTSIVLGIVIYMAFEGMNESLKKGRVDVRRALFDPFVTNYFVGNEVPNRFKIDGMHNLWTYNRLLFLGIAVVLFALTWLLLKRERLHESFVD